MLIQLERDRCERMSVPFDEKKVFETIQKKQERPPIEEIKHGIKTVKTLYTEARAPGVKITCLKTIATMVGNVHKNPTEAKFQTVNLGNEKIQERVGKINGGKIIFKGFGFEEDVAEKKMILKKYDAKIFTEGIELLQNELR